MIALSTLWRVFEERAERCGSVAVSLAHLPSRKKLRKKQKRKKEPVEEEGFGLAGPPKIYSTNRAPKGRPEPGKPKHSKLRSGREQRKARNVFVDPETFVAHHIPVEKFFPGKSVKESGRGFGIDFATVPPSATHGLGTSPSSATKQKPHRKKKHRKFKVPPTGK
jgi:hypothetical protein